MKDPADDPAPALVPVRLGPDLRTKPGLLAAKAQVGAARRGTHVEPGVKAARRAKGKQAKQARRRHRG